MQKNDTPLTSNPHAGPEGPPMACRRAGVLIEKSLARVATGSELRQLDEHLASCVKCREYFSDAEFLGSVFSGIRVRFPEAARLEQRSRRGRLVHWITAVAAVLFLAAGLAWLAQGFGAGGASRDRTASAGAVAEYLGVGIAVGRKAIPAVPTAGNTGIAVERVPVAGLLIVEVLPGSWADKAGLEPGDRILEASGVRLAGVNGRWALDYMLRNLPENGSAPLLILREGRLLRFRYNAGER